MNVALIHQMAEYSYLRVFNVHPGMAMSKVLRPELYIYAKDTGMSRNFYVSEHRCVIRANCKPQSSFSAVLPFILADQRQTSYEIVLLLLIGTSRTWRNMRRKLSPKDYSKARLSRAIQVPEAISLRQKYIISVYFFM